MKALKKVNPWAWISTLYFAEGLPYVAVMTISVIMYKRLGISNTDIALYTGWLYLPWVIKPFWSPFIDLIRTKRWWTTTMQWLIAIAFACIAFSIPTPFFFRLTLAFFWLVAFSSATHDIAADGYYMHALTEHEQSLYVGIRSTFYRIATVAGQGLLVIVAGLIETGTGLTPAEVTIEASPQYTNTLTLPQFAADATAQTSAGGENCFVFTDAVVKAGVAVDAKEGAGAKDKIAQLTDSIKALNMANGFIAKEEAKAAVATTAAETSNEGWGSAFTKWVHDTFGEEEKATA